MTRKDYSVELDENGNLSAVDAIEKWRNESPIPLCRSDLDELPDDTFNDGFMAAVIQDVARSTETPLELAGFLGMAAIATIAAKKFSVLVEPGYFEPMNIWAAAAMDPSNRKSAVLKAMAGPILEWERQQSKALKPVIEQSRSERKTLEKIIADARKNVSKIDDAVERQKAIEGITKLENELPEVPTVPQLLINDCTPERVAALLQDQGERISFIDSEADSLFAMMLGRYSDSPVLDVYLKSYSGDNVKVDRQTKEPICLHHPLMTMGIAPQPGLIQDLVKKPVLVQRGLLSRFLFLLPKSKVGSRTLEPSAVSESAVMQYNAGLEYLLALPSNIGENEREIPYTIKFSADGYRVWKAWQREVEPMLKEDGRLADSALKFWGGKLAGNTARMAGILHIAVTAPARRPDEVLISETTAQRAVDAARMMIDHSIAVHDLAVTTSEKHRAIQILEWLKRKRRDLVTVRELHQSLRRRTSFQETKDVRDGCEILLEHGWLYIQPHESKSGRPSESFFVHPQVHPQYPRNGRAKEQSNSFEDIEYQSSEIKKQEPASVSEIEEGEL